jgi:hypothetical protein
MKKFLTISNAIYAFSILFALGVLAKVYYDRSTLPEGICPTDYNDRFIYASIIILIAGIVITSILDYNKKKAIKDIDHKNGEDD